MGLVRYTNGRIRYAKDIKYIWNKFPVKFILSGIDGEGIYKYKLFVHLESGRIYETIWATKQAFIELVDRPKFWNCLLEVHDEEFIGTVQSWLYLRNQMNQR